MNATDMKELMERMFMLINTRVEIAKLEVKNQNAPMYLHRQAQGIEEGMMFKLRLLAEAEEGK